MKYTVLTLFRTLCVYVGIAALGAVLLLPASVDAQDILTDHPILYLFWGDGCPHCEDEKKFLENLQDRYPELEMRYFEVWNVAENRAIAEGLRQAYELTSSSVPMTFIGRWTITGYEQDTTTGKQIERQIDACLQRGCINALTMLGPSQAVLDIRKQIQQDALVDWVRFPAKATPQPVTTTSSEETITAPVTEQPEAMPPPNDSINTILGTLSVSNLGLPIFTCIIALLDGFNPCAMWVLSFLLTLVIHARSRKKIALIGGIFVITSGVIYFIFMTGWLNFYTMGILRQYTNYLRITVALVAIVMGFINCKDFFFFKRGISLTIPESAQPKLFKKMRELVHAQATVEVIFGTVVLAVTANLIEFGCTVGFPAFFTQVLTLQKFSTLTQYLYLAAYNVVYVIPLAVIVGIFAWTMGGRKLTEKEGRILKLVGGALMLALGLILLIKPDLLSFG